MFGDQARGTVFSATRKLTDCTEVGTVRAGGDQRSGEINKPRIPSLKQVLAAAKKAFGGNQDRRSWFDSRGLTPKVICISVKGFVMSRKNVVYKDSDAADKVAKLVASLKEGCAKGKWQGYSSFPKRMRSQVSC